MWVPAAVVLLACAGLARSAGYCSQNTLVSNSSGMQLTKEPVPLEYGFEDKFKSIHCCGKGYRSIEWFKDNVAYPWSAGVSSLIQYPEAANQTLYTQRASRSDTGNYTCRISNETHSEQHTIRLEILEKPPDAPKTMYISKDQWARVAGSVRLYCEVLVGRSYLADFRSELRWKKLWPNDTEGDLLPTQKEEKTKRDDIEDIVGAYLVFEKVTAADYGTYVCVVNSNQFVSKSYVTLHYKTDADAPASTFAERAVPWRMLCLGGACAVLLLGSLLALHRQCTPRALLAARIALARANATTQRARVLEKEFDVLVCWTSVDAELARGVLLPTLSRKYNYRVHAMQIDTQPDNWYKVLSGPVSRCRSLVAVVSPAQHSAAQLHVALRQLRDLGVPPVVVLLQDLPKLKSCPKDAQGESLVALLRRTRLLAWRHVHERAFWTALRLALPLPPRQLDDKPVKVTVVDNKSSRSGSLTALV